MRNAIVTCSDAVCGDFLCQHFISSLKANVDLRDIDIIVIDYGLTASQRRALLADKVILRKGLKDCHVVVARCRDIADFLDPKRYAQVLVCDGGDIIFQDDISQLFRSRSAMIRAVVERYCPPFEKVYTRRVFEGAQADRIWKLLKGKSTINAGLFVGPCAKIKRLYRECFGMIHNRVFMGDQLSLNYLLYKEGFEPLAETYNYILPTASKPCYVVDGVFYYSSGEKIKVVHNVGSRIFRFVRDYGYGPGRNRINRFRYLFWRTFARAAQALK